MRSYAEYCAIAKSLDVVGDRWTLLIVNALLIPFVLSGIRMFESGFASAEDIDKGVVLGAAHPLRLRAALFSDPRGQFAASSTVLRFQVPRYEHVLTRNDAELVGELMARWSGPQWKETPDFDDYVRRCREAMQIPQAAFCALEAYRWPSPLLRWTRSGAPPWQASP